MASNTLNIELLLKDNRFKTDIKALNVCFEGINKQLAVFTEGITSVCKQMQCVGTAVNAALGKGEANTSAAPAKADVAGDTKKEMTEIEKATEQGAFQFTTGWANAFKVFKSELADWQKLAKDGFKNIKDNLAATTSSMIRQIGKGWNGMHDIVKKSGEMMLDSVIDMLGKMVSEWALKYIVIAGIEEAWALGSIAAKEVWAAGSLLVEEGWAAASLGIKQAWAMACAAVEKGWTALKIALGFQVATAEQTQRGEVLATNLAADTAEISSAAAVGAAKAAAASAWTLWGAIAIGAAIGMAIMAFAGSFATGGIVGGNSFSGDRMLARVNSGEMILNSAQQARLFDMANGEAAGQNTGGNAVINQTINVNGGGDLNAITQAIKRGTVEALEFANVTYKAGAKRNKYVG